MTFINYLGSSGVHGLAHLAEPGLLIIKLLWTTFILAAFGVCIWLISKVVIQYSEFNFSTMIVINRTDDLVMPAITLCSGYGNIHEMLLECQFGNGNDECRTDNLTIFAYDGKLSQNCVRFNAGSNHSQLQQSIGVGPDHGYRIVLFWSGLITYAVSDNNILAVGDETTVTTIMPGYTNTIIVAKTVQKLLGNPYSKCDVSKVLRNSAYDYRDVNCIQDCFYRAMTQACGCEFPQGCPPYREWNNVCSLAYLNRNIMLSACEG